MRDMATFTGKILVTLFAPFLGIALAWDESGRHRERLARRALMQARREAKIEALEATARALASSPSPVCADYGKIVAPPDLDGVK